MQGYYIFMDYCTNRIWSLTPDGNGGWDSNVQVLGGFGNITTFGEDEDGELYSASDGGSGSIYRVIDNNVPLPAQLEKFNGEIQTAGILLKWQSASLENFDRFIIERSQDARNFQVIGEQIANSNSVQIQNFSYLDKEASYGHYYYRLKMLDLDGSYTYSRTIHFERKTRPFSLYPNPSSGIVFVQFSEEQEGPPSILQLFDRNGRLVASKRVGDALQLRWDLSGLPHGLYFLAHQSGEEKLLYQKLLLK